MEHRHEHTNTVGTHRGNSIHWQGRQQEQGRWQEE